MSQFSFEQKIEILSKMALDYCNENGLKFKQYNQKFAELIVRECAEVAGCNGHVSGFSLGDLIKEHFGFK